MRLNVICDTFPKQRGKCPRIEPLSTSMSGVWGEKEKLAKATKVRRRRKEKAVFQRPNKESSAEEAGH